MSVIRNLNLRNVGGETDRTKAIKAARLVLLRDGKDIEPADNVLPEVVFVFEDEPRDMMIEIRPNSWDEVAVLLNARTVSIG